MIPMEAAPEAVKEVVTTASILNHLRSNRLEYAIVAMALHLLGLSDKFLGSMQGVCF